LIKRGKGRFYGPCQFNFETVSNRMGVDHRRSQMAKGGAHRERKPISLKLSAPLPKVTEPRTFLWKISSPLAGEVG
jgi:hypothetical protein